MFLHAYRAPQGGVVVGRGNAADLVREENWDFVLRGDAPRAAELPLLEVAELAATIEKLETVIDSLNVRWNESTDSFEPVLPWVLELFYKLRSSHKFLVALQRAATSSLPERVFDPFEDEEEEGQE